MQVPISQSPPEILTVEHVLGRYGFSRTTLWRLRETGDFPRPLIIGSRAIRWRRVDLEAWESSGCPKIAAGDANLAVLEQIAAGGEDYDVAK